MLRKPRAQALAFDIPHCAKTFRYYADLSVHTRRREPIAVSGSEAWSARTPYGVCGFIFPWNFPFLLVGWGIALALAAAATPLSSSPLKTRLCQHYIFANWSKKQAFPPV